MTPGCVCDHNGCTDDATTALRMGDGTWTHASKVNRQTYVRYCDTHLVTVHGLFVTCDEQPLALLQAGRGGGGIHLRR